MVNTSLSSIKSALPAMAGIFSPGPETFPADQSSFSFFCPIKQVLGNALSFDLLGSTNGTRAMQHEPFPTHKQAPPTHNDDIFKAIFVLLILVMSNPLSAKQICQTNFYVPRIEQEEIQLKLKPCHFAQNLIKVTDPKKKNLSLTDFHIEKKWQLKPQCTEK